MFSIPWIKHNIQLYEKIYLTLKQTKMRIKLWLYLIVIGFTFASCEKDDDFRGGPPAHSKAKANKEAAVELSNGSVSHELFDGASVTVDLIAGQHYHVGEVEVIIEGEFMYVIYSTYPGSYLTETHLHIGSDPDDFPLVGSNNPQVGRFMYKEAHDFVTEYTYKIPAEYLPGLDNGDCYHIAAHAVVNSGDDNLESFSELLVEIPTASLEIPFPIGGGDTYFREIFVSNAGFLDGTYGGWCLQPYVPFKNGEFNYYVYSSYGQTLPDPNDFDDYSGDFLNRVNWILNQRFQDEADYTTGDVQIAIWVLKLGEDNFEDAEAGMDPAAISSVKNFDPDRVDYIISQALTYGSDFIADCGDVFAIIFVNSQNQDVIIEYPVPCNYGEETAWGDGMRFNQRGNWAMYFQLCAENV